jgi:hypothetical protein
MKSAVLTFATALLLSTAAMAADGPGKPLSSDPADSVLPEAMENDAQAPDMDKTAKDAAEEPGKVDSSDPRSVE